MKKLRVLMKVVFNSVWAAAPFTAVREARIKENIRKTLVSNPDVLAQAVDAWQQQTAGQQISQVINQNAHTPYQDPANFAATRQKTGVKEVVPSGQSMATLRTNMQLAQQLGVQGTPATVIVNLMLSGAVSYEELESRVKQQRTKAKNV